MSKSMPFNLWLKQRRKALGLTQNDLAQQAGCAEVTLRKIEAGDLQPSAALAASLAKAVGATDADLPGSAGFAPPGTTAHPPVERWRMPRRPHNLPGQLTPLIGRTQDIAAVRKRLLTDDARLITLLGPPGVGKTRLAQAVAEDVLEQFEDGAFFVRLGPISDPTLVASAIAQALDLQMTGSNPPAMQLRRYLEEKHLLLVLDNFEQVIEAAALVDDLLRRCQWLHVLVTSRQALRVRGERQVPVLPLALPADVPGAASTTANEVLRYSAVALFEERAQAVQPDFAVSDVNAAPVAELCRRLDGLPLAIELVAARVKLLPPAQLLARVHGPWMLSVDGLRDVSARQKTLRGAIGWSYDLLTPAEQALFNRLAVFVGGCTLQAAELMCGDDATLGPPLPFSLSPIQVLDGIGSLLDKSLLHRQAGIHGEPRYVMLETVREYGLERIGVSGQEAVLRERHMHCILQLIEKVDQADPSPFRVHLRRMIDDEIHNLRAALDWAMEHDVQTALQLTAALVSWLFGRGPMGEAEPAVARVFALPGASSHTIARARVLFEVGLVMNATNQPGAAQAHHEESLVLSRDLGYRKGEANALLGLGRVANRNRHLDGARSYYDGAFAIYRELNDVRGIAYSGMLLANIAYSRADYSQARALAEECLAIARQAGYSNPWPLVVMGNIVFAHGDLNEAWSLWQQALAMMDAKGIREGTLAWMGLIAAMQGDFPTAHALLDEARILFRELYERDSLEVICFRAILAQAEQNYDDAIRWYRATLPVPELDREVWGLFGLGLAGLALALEQYVLAARLLGTIDAVDEADFRLMPIERNDYNRLAETTRAHLGTQRFDAAWAEGRATPFGTAVEAAVSVLEDVLRVQEQVPPG